MSLDWYLEVPNVCANCGTRINCRCAKIYWRNITHNVVPMWRKAGVYDALYMSHGKRAALYLEAVEAGVKDMEDNFPEYVALDASNGWGKAEHALPFLRDIAKAIRDNPDAVIRVSK